METLPICIRKQQQSLIVSLMRNRVNIGERVTLSNLLLVKNRSVFMPGSQLGYITGSVFKEKQLSFTFLFSILDTALSMHGSTCSSKVHNYLTWTYKLQHHSNRRVEGNDFPR